MGLGANNVLTQVSLKVPGSNLAWETKVYVNPVFWVLVSVGFLLLMK